MRSDRLQDAIGEMDDRFIQDAETAVVREKKTRTWRVAICAALATAACACIVAVSLRGIKNAGREKIPVTSDSEDWNMSVGGVMRNYKNDGDVPVGESAIVWPWEELMAFERYSVIDFGGRTYTFWDAEAEGDLVGDILGTGDCVGYDPVEGVRYPDGEGTVFVPEEHRESFTVRQIKGIPQELAIAVEADGRYYACSVSKDDEDRDPRTLGDFLAIHDLPELLNVKRYGVRENNREMTYQRLSDDRDIWKFLEENSDAKRVDDQVFKTGRVTLIAYFREVDLTGCDFEISEEGHIRVYSFGRLYTFDIGRENASEFISKISVEPDKTGYDDGLFYRVAGTVTGIGEDYILINDSILCVDENDGVEFKVLTSDKRVGRWLKAEHIEVGDVVVIPFRKPVKVGDENIIDSATGIILGSLSGDGYIDAQE